MGPWRRDPRPGPSFCKRGLGIRTGRRMRTLRQEVQSRRFGEGGNRQHRHARRLRRIQRSSGLPGTVGTLAEAVTSLLTNAEAAERLKVSARTLRREVADGRLRGVRIRGCWRIAQADLDSYL